MEKAVVLYNSQTGTTGNYAREIGKYLEEKEVGVQVSSIEDYQQEILAEADYVFLGSWTKGMMVLFQHPDAVWKEFVNGLPNMPGAKISLFTTYKILTGSMFKNMAKELQDKFTAPALELKSRDGTLSRQDKQALDQFLM